MYLKSAGVQRNIHTDKIKEEATEPEPDVQMDVVEFKQEKEEKPVRSSRRSIKIDPAASDKDTTDNKVINTGERDDKSKMLSPNKPKVSPVKPKVESAKPKVSPVKPTVESAKPKVESAKPKVSPVKPKVETAKSVNDVDEELEETEEEMKAVLENLKKKKKNLFTSDFESVSNF